MINPAFRGWRETYNNVGNVSGATTIDFANGNYQRIQLGGATTLNFTFPGNADNQNARIVVWVNVANPAYTLTLPVEVTQGDVDTIAGISGSVITFNADELANSNDYLFEFSTVDAGSTDIQIRDLTRNRAAVHSGLSISGNLTVNDGTISTNYAYHTIANDDNLFANNTTRTFFIDSNIAGSLSDTVANAYITLPNTAIDGQQVTFSFLAPITALRIQKDSGDPVKYIWSNVAATGNTSVNFTYSSGNTNWLRS